MSNRWPGGLVRRTPVTPTGPLQNGAAPGMWTLAEASYWTKQGLWPTAGNFLAVEDVFSTYLYTGNGGTQTITNGIDIAGKGAMIWTKNRVAAQWHCIADTVRGLGNNVFANDTSANQAQAAGITSSSSTGYTIGGWNGVNVSGQTQVSWTFREAPNFFDVVTYTGNGAASQTISHNLGGAPGCIIVKRTDAVGLWAVYHRGTAIPNNTYLRLNAPNAADNLGANIWNVTSTTFNVDDGALSLNASGGTYVAYLFAHDTSSTGLIQCGSFTTSASGYSSVNLGWEPQWVLIKTTGTSQNWFIFDNMRGFPVTGNSPSLSPNLSNAEDTTVTNGIRPTATGFDINADYFGGSRAYIYIAIRRGPMRTPTLGTTVFNMATRVGTGTNTVLTGAGFPVDLVVAKSRFVDWEDDWNWGDRLRGISSNLSSNKATAQAGNTGLWFNSFASMTGYTVGSGSSINRATSNFIDYYFRRAPSFFDEVCYTGTGSATTLNHNLGVVPELMIVKARSGDYGARGWAVWLGPLYSGGVEKDAYLNTTAAATSDGLFGNTAPTSSVFSLSTDGFVNGPVLSTPTQYVAWLFASCPGVSKVGSYTGNGSSQTINCAFTTGARFVMIKRTDSTGDWYVWDSARGIVAANDPYLALNSTAAEVTTNDSVDTDNSGFIVNQVAASNVNVNGGTYIFLAVA